MDSWTIPSRGVPPCSFGGEAPEHYCIDSTAYKLKFVTRSQSSSGRLAHKPAPAVISDDGYIIVSAAAMKIERQESVVRRWAAKGWIRSRQGKSSLYVHLADAKKQDKKRPKKGRNKRKAKYGI